MTTTIRFATATDAPAIAAIYAPIVSDTTISFELVPPDADTMADRIRAGGRLHPWLVAATPGTGTLAGFASAGPFRGRPAYRWCVETSVYVDPAWRGQGVARTLYGTLLRMLAAQGYRRAVAGIALPNDASVAFHRRLGFASAGVSPAVGWKHDRWIDMSWWQRDPGAAKLEAPQAPDVGPPAGDPRPATDEDLREACSSRGPRVTCDA